MATPQNYIILYQSLSIPQKSREANFQLIKIQQSDESWMIAKSLISNQKYYVHGCQLLSRKLNRPYTLEMESKLHLLEFLFQLQDLLKPICCILAKLALHFNWTKIQLDEKLNSQRNIIKILTCIPQATGLIIIASHKIDTKQNAQILFNQYKNTLIKNMKNFPNQVIECVQSFVLSCFKVNSQEIVRFLLTKPLEQVSECLQQILLNESYPNLSQQIYNYLLQYENSQFSQFFTLFLAFSSSVNLTTMSPDILSGIINKILSIMKIQNTLSADLQKNCGFIGDSFDFWEKIKGIMFQSVSQNLPQTPQLIILRNSLVQVLKIVIERSIQTEIPKFKQQSKQNLSISVDDQEENEDQWETQIDLVSNKFRDTAQDFFSLICSLFNKILEVKNQTFLLLFELAKSSTNLLHLQLLIFVLTNMIQYFDITSIEQTNNLFLLITHNPNSKHPYIWQQLIKLMGQLGHQTICDLRILSTSLEVLKESIMVEALSILACENFYSILQTCNNSSEKVAQTPFLQQFLDYIIANVYFKTNNKKLFEKITKTFIYFTYYFRPEKEYLMDYLNVMGQKIMSLQSNQQKVTILQNIAESHLYISSEVSKQFVQILSLFFGACLSFIIKLIETCPQKKISQIFQQINVIVTAAAGYNTNIWTNFAGGVVNFQKVSQQKSVLVNFLTKLIIVQQHDENYNQTVVPFIQNNLQIVTKILSQSSENDYQIINKCLNFHMVVLKNYVDLIRYNPDEIFNFILGKILHGYLKFQFESSRTSLAILRYIIAKQYRSKQILTQILKAYPKLADLLWKTLEAVLIEAYRVCGENLYKEVFKQINPSLLPPNPLFDAIMQAFKQCETKTIKNLLTCLK